MNLLKKTLAFIFCIFLYISFSANIVAFGQGDFQKGMCYVTWSRDAFMGTKSDESLLAMSKTGVNTVQIVPTWYQNDIDSLVIKRVENRTPSDESIIHAIKKAHEYGMAVMLKPHIDLLKEEGNYRLDIGFTKEEDWQEWFCHYKKFILSYARMAEENKVEFFCVGTELSYAATKDEYWSEYIIPAVREVYSGKITYAANWDDYQNVKFWGSLDYAGIDAYFPLTNKENPEFEDIKTGWEKWLKEIRLWQADVQKPVVFTECGYCSADLAARKPWEEISARTPNLALQADCYRALMETFCGEPYFKGLYWWSWSTYAGSGGVNHSRFTPQNKPAMEYVKLWYLQRFHDAPAL